MSEVTDERLVALLATAEFYASDTVPFKDQSQEEHAEIAAALRELLQLRQSRRWQPIATAPGSHKMFLVHAPTSQRGPVDYAFKEFNTGRIMVQTMAGWDHIENFGGTATHWQPLPPPPLEEPQHE